MRTHKANKTFWALVILAGLFAAVGIITPPKGEISTSVLIFIGQILLLAAGVINIPFVVNLREGIFRNTRNNDKSK